MRFDLYEDEKVVLFTRKHWFVLLVHILPTIIGFILALALLYVGIDRMAKYFEGSFWLGLYGAGILGIIFWSAVYTQWLNYYLDVWIVTNIRVFDINQVSFFSREVSEFRLDKVQDVTVEVKGLLQTLLNFGVIRVQTAGGFREFYIKSVPDPKKISAVVAEGSRNIKIRQGVQIEEDRV